MKRTTCAACSAPITQAGTGRPRRFCSVGCRKATDHEVRRLDRHLGEAELSLSAARTALAKFDAGLGHVGGTQTGPTHRFNVERAEIRVQELNERLRVLLDEDDEP